MDNPDENKIYLELKEIRKRGYPSPSMKDTLLLFDPSHQQCIINHIVKLIKG
jgi:hypothetical protein